MNKIAAFRKAHVTPSKTNCSNIKTTGYYYAIIIKARELVISQLTARLEKKINYIHPENQ